MTLLSFIPLATITVICVVASLASLFALLLQKITKRSFGRHRLIGATLLLSVAVVAMTLLLIFVPLPTNFSLYDVLYYGILAFVVFFAVLFFRKIGLWLFVLYFACTAFLFFSLATTADGNLPEYTIELTADSVKLNEKTISISETVINTLAEKDMTYVHCFAISIPEAFPLLINPQWVFFSELNENSTKEFNLDTVSLNLVAKTLLRIFSAVTDNLAGSISYYSEYSIPLGPVEFLPALYKINGGLSKGELYFTITQLL